MERNSSDDINDINDINFRAVLGFGLGLLLVGIAIHIVVWLLFVLLSTQQATHGAPEFPLAAGQENRLPPEPRLQTNPRQDLRNLRAQEDVVLGSYGWVDKNAGVVRIPIERAMQLTVEHGLPARPSTDAARLARERSK